MLRNRRQAGATAPSAPAPVATIDDRFAGLKAKTKAAAEEANRLERELQAFPAKLQEARARFDERRFVELCDERLRVFRRMKAARVESLQYQVEIGELKDPALKADLDRLRTESEDLERRSKQAKVDFISASFAYSGNIRSRLAREEELERARCMKLPRVEPLADDYEAA